MRTRKPYRLAHRAALSPEPPFTATLVQRMIAEARRGPKAGRASPQPEPSDEAIKCFCSVLNARAMFFYAAQEARSIKDRRDHAKALIDELRQIMPAIIKDAEQQKLKDDFFARNAFAAASALHEVLSSDVPRRAFLPVTLPENIYGWQWCAGSLFEDVRPLVGSNAAVRFLVAAIPRLSGESPKLSAVETWLKKQHQKASA